MTRFLERFQCGRRLGRNERKSGRRNYFFVLHEFCRNSIAFKKVERNRKAADKESEGQNNGKIEGKIERAGTVSQDSYEGRPRAAWIRNGLTEKCD